MHRPTEYRFTGARRASSNRAMPVDAPLIYLAPTRGHPTHGAFDLPDAPRDAPPRESIEARCLVIHE
jgi:hypothetical protein